MSHCTSINNRRNYFISIKKKIISLAQLFHLIYKCEMLTKYNIFNKYIPSSTCKYTKIINRFLL